MSDIQDVYREVERLRSQLDELPEQLEQRGLLKPRRRVSKDDVLAGFVASLNRGGQEHSSVRIARNARGDTQFEVVVRSGDTPEISTAAEAMAEATRLYQVLDEAFAMRKADNGE